METIEKLDEWRGRYNNWREKNRVGSSGGDNDVGSDYPFIVNKRAAFRPLGRALPMLNLALIGSAGAYIDGTQAFDESAAGGDVTFREIPIEVEAEDLRYVARGFDSTAVLQDRNAQFPIDRLFEFSGNGIIGKLNPVFWSFCGFIPDAAQMTNTMLPELVARVKRYEVDAVLLVPASRLCHQSTALVARALEDAGVATMMLAVARDVVDMVRAPRAVYYKGEFGQVAGHPSRPEYQRRILDESLRLLEPFDQPGVRKLVVDLETSVEKERGEKQR